MENVIIPTTRKYNLFANLVLKTSLQPLGYIPGLSKQCATTISAFLKLISSQKKKQRKVMESITLEQSKIWNALIETMDI